MENYMNQSKRKGSTMFMRSAVAKEKKAGPQRSKSSSPDPTFCGD
jgi:hypothetical protein